MNNLLWRTRLLSVGGVLEIAMGVGLLANPRAVVALLLRAPLEGPGVVLGRLAGAGVLSLGIACWQARSTPASPASIGAAWAFLAYNVIASVLLAWAGLQLASGGLLVLAASALHGVLGVALLVALRGRRAVLVEA